MIEDDKKRETPDDVADDIDTRPRFTLLVIVSMLSGFLLCLGSVGVYFSFQTIGRLETELVTARQEAKKKNAALEEAHAQIGALSKQISVLKEFSVARSRENETKKTAATPDAAIPSGAPVSPAPVVPSEVKTKEIKTKEVTADREASFSDAKAKASLARVKEQATKSPAQNCELVGKSPEEQAATLKRCVSVMDDVAGMPGSAPGKQR